jgi:hypothetical protein
MSATVHKLPLLLPADEAFNEWWTVYPKKVGKPLAQAKWNAITNGGLRTRTLDKDSGTYVEIDLRATPEELIEGARRYDERNRKQGVGEYGYVDNGKYLCHPSTWLNQGRWMDG